MQITYELTEKDFIEAYSAHRNRSAVRKCIRRLFLWGIGLTAASIFFGFLLKPSIEAAKGLAPFFAVVIMWILILVFLPRWTMRRQFTGQPGAKGQRIVQFDDSGAHWRWNGGSSDVEWKNYIRWVEGKNQFLIYTSPVCFNMIPKRVLADEQLGQFRELLKQHIPGF